MISFLIQIVQPIQWISRTGVKITWKKLIPSIVRIQSHVVTPCVMATKSRRKKFKEGKWSVGGQLEFASARSSCLCSLLTHFPHCYICLGRAYLIGSLSWCSFYQVYTTFHQIMLPPVSNHSGTPAHSRSLWLFFPF
jgi:hypothetical protein